MSWMMNFAMNRPESGDDMEEGAYERAIQVEAVYLSHLSLSSSLYVSISLGLCLCLRLDLAYEVDDKLRQESEPESGDNMTEGACERVIQA